MAQFVGRTHSEKFDSFPKHIMVSRLIAMSRHYKGTPCRFNAEMVTNDQVAIRLYSGDKIQQ